MTHNKIYPCGMIKVCFNLYLNLNMSQTQTDKTDREKTLTRKVYFTITVV